MDETANPTGDGEQVRARVEHDIERLPGMARAAALYPGVLEAIARVPRHMFCPADVADQAIEDRPLPIGFGQTISQPLIVAVMTGLLRPSVYHRVLEIGTGSGYQAAVLARLVGHVVSVEIIPELARRAAETLASLGVGNVEVHVGDGRDGWPNAAPYDGIIATACSGDVPRPLLELAPGGRLVIPIGVGDQQLKVIARDAAGHVTESDVLAVRFVPFV